MEEIPRCDRGGRTPCAAFACDPALDGGTGRAKPRRAMGTWHRRVQLHPDRNVSRPGNDKGLSPGRRKMDPTSCRSIPGNDERLGASCHRCCRRGERKDDDTDQGDRSYDGEQRPDDQKTRAHAGWKPPQELIRFAGGTVLRRSAPPLPIYRSVGSTSLCDRHIPAQGHFCRWGDSG